MAIVLVLALMAIDPSLPGHQFWYGELALAVVLSYVFARRQGIVATPLIEPGLVRIVNVTGGVLLGVLSFSVLYGMLFLTPFYFERVRGLHPSQVGVLIASIALAMTAVAPVAGTLADRFGNRVVAVAGLLATAAGALLLFLWTPQIPFGWTIPAMVLAGAGAGVFTPPNNSSVMGSSPTEHLGVTGGLLNMGRSIGISAGVALTAAMYALSPSGPYAGFRSAALALLAVAVFSLVLQAVLPREKHPGARHDIPPLLE
jgi:MFS family permease